MSEHDHCFHFNSGDECWDCCRCGQRMTGEEHAEWSARKPARPLSVERGQALQEEYERDEKHLESLIHASMADANEWEEAQSLAAIWREWGKTHDPDPSAERAAVRFAQHIKVLTEARDAWESEYHRKVNDLITQRSTFAAAVQAWWYEQGQYLRPQDGDAAAWDAYHSEPVPAWVSWTPAMCNLAHRLTGTLNPINVEARDEKDRAVAEAATEAMNWARASAFMGRRYE